jgi:hypothetical protein
MAEKRGNTVKIQYDFPTQLCLEVNFIDEKWARVTPRDFRSFGGKRRILNISNPKNVHHEEYNGPIYFYETNEIIPTQDVVKGINYKDGKRIDKRRTDIVKFG